MVLSDIRLSKLMPMSRGCARLGLSAVLLAVALAAASAGDAPIGLVTSSGDFLIDQARVSGNATLREGTLVETIGAPSALRLRRGAEIDLGERTKARVFADRLVLEAGISDFRAGAGYAIEAASLLVRPASARTRGLIVRPSDRIVQLGVSEGAVQVFNARGILIANVVPGTPLEFEPQVAGAAPPSSFAGCLLQKQGRWVLYDQTTRLVIQLRGAGFEKEWGNRVQVIGTTDVGAQSEVAAQVVDVTSLTRLAQGGCEGVAKIIGAELPAKPVPPGPPVQMGGGMSAGTKVAILAALGGGAGAGAYFATQKKDRSP